MTIADKLKRLTEERIKSKVCRRAGLPAQTINAIIFKRYTPRADVALRLARALEVDVRWLIDDEQDFPAVPAASTPKATSAA